MDAAVNGAAMLLAYLWRRKLQSRNCHGKLFS